MIQLSKTIKCILLKSDNAILIGQVEEIDAELGEANCKLTKPYQIESLTNLMPWPYITNDSEIYINSDSILTIVDPKPELVKKYLELVSG